MTASERLIDALIIDNCSISEDMWREFWTELHSGSVGAASAAAVMSSLSTAFPNGETLLSLLRSLRTRTATKHVSFGGAVNIVGTGGGYTTFNISTAAAFVAAATGLPVVKSGSRALTSQLGSVDMLVRLGITPATSYVETQSMLDQFGIAFTGMFVYPQEIIEMQRTTAQLNSTLVRRFFNTLGPLLSQLPVTTQLVGVADAKILPALRTVAQELDRNVWLCSNSLRVDELVSISDNTIDDGIIQFRTSDKGISDSEGSLADLDPSTSLGEAAHHFTTILSGSASIAATQTVCLNAAAMIVASRGGSWPEALAEAHRAISSGTALQLLERCSNRSRRVEHHA